MTGALLTLLDNFKFCFQKVDNKCRLAIAICKLYHFPCIVLLTSAVIGLLVYQINSKTRNTVMITHFHYESLSMQYTEF